MGRLEFVCVYIVEHSQPEIFTLQNKALCENAFSVPPLSFSHDVHDKKIPKV